MLELGTGRPSTGRPRGDLAWRPWRAGPDDRRRRTRAGPPGHAGDAREDEARDQTPGRRLPPALTGPDLYDDVKYERLVNLKGTHDPANVVRLNQNVEPG